MNLLLVWIFCVSDCGCYSAMHLYSICIRRYTLTNMLENTRLVRVLGKDFVETENLLSKGSWTKGRIFSGKSYMIYSVLPMPNQIHF